MSKNTDFTEVCVILILLVLVSGWGAVRSIPYHAKRPTTQKDRSPTTQKEVQRKKTGLKIPK